MQIARAALWTSALNHDDPTVKELDSQVTALIKPGGTGAASTQQLRDVEAATVAAGT